MGVYWTYQYQNDKQIYFDPPCPNFNKLMSINWSYWFQVMLITHIWYHFIFGHMLQISITLITTITMLSVTESQQNITFIKSYNRRSSVFDIFILKALQSPLIKVSFSDFVIYVVVAEVHPIIFNTFKYCIEMFLLIYERIPVPFNSPLKWFISFSFLSSCTWLGIVTNSLWYTSWYISNINNKYMF